MVYPVACHDNSRSCNRFLTTSILTVQVVRNLHFAICTCVRKATSHYPQRQEATICIRIARVTNLAHSLKAGKKCNHGNGCQKRSESTIPTHSLGNGLLSTIQVICVFYKVKFFAHNAFSVMSHFYTKNCLYWHSQTPLIRTPKGTQFDCICTQLLVKTLDVNANL